MDTTAIIISFNRPEYTLDCVNTLKAEYPKINLLVGENGTPSEEVQRAVERRKGKYIIFPFDSGVPYVRNQLFKMVDTQYVLIGDDDFWYSKLSRVNDMEKFLDTHPEYAIIGGRVREKGKIADWQGYLHIHPKGIFFDRLPAEKLYYKYCYKSKLYYCTVDMMTNYWLGRLRELPNYEEDQKVYHEHTRYHVELYRRNIKMAFSPQIVVDHKKKKYFYPDYAQFRKRKNEKDYLTKKYGHYESGSLTNAKI